MTAKEKLTALADAVREKTGETGLLTLDTMTSLISSLEGGGGGLPSGWAMGQFNATSATMRGGFPIEHGLGAIPNLVVVFKENQELVGMSARCAFRVNIGEYFDEEVNDYIPDVSAQRCFYDDQYGTKTNNVTGSNMYEDTREVFVVPEMGSNVYYMPHLTYRWIAMKLEV